MTTRHVTRHNNHTRDTTQQTAPPLRGWVSSIYHQNCMFCKHSLHCKRNKHNGHYTNKNFGLVTFDLGVSPSHRIATLDMWECWFMFHSAFRGSTTRPPGCTTASVAQPLGRPLPPPLAARHGTAQHCTAQAAPPPPPPQPYPPGPYRKSALKIDQNEVLCTHTRPLGPNVIFLCCLPLPWAQSSAQSSRCMKYKVHVVLSGICMHHAPHTCHNVSSHKRW